jgi:RNA polymerase sigma-70 factor (ECF subfamily)
VTIEPVDTETPRPVTQPMPLVESFERFYSREYSAVLGLAYVLTGSWPNAEEITQDAFSRAYRRWARVKNLESPGGWVRRVVANEASSLRRRAATALRHRHRLHERDASDHADRADDERIWAAVRQLPHRQAQAIALRFVHGLSTAEIAAVLGCSTETAKTHLARGRRTLAVRLEELR